MGLQPMVGINSVNLALLIDICFKFNLRDLIRLVDQTFRFPEYEM